MGIKGKTKWVGSKCHIVETAEKDETNIITDMIYQSANENDNKILEKVEENNQRLNLDIGKLFCDSNYLSGEKLKRYEDNGEKLMGYLQGESSPRPKGFQVADFKVDMDNETALCPANQEAKDFARHSDLK